LRAGPFAAAILLPACSCILDPAAEPGYPSRYAMAVECGSFGSPSCCDIRDDLAVGGAGDELLIIDCANRDLLFETALQDTVKDVAMGDSWALALLPGSVVPVSLSSGQPGDPVELPSEGVGITACSGKVAVLCSDGTIVLFDEGSWGSVTIVRTGLEEPTGMTADSTLSAVYADDPAGSRMVRIDPLSGQVTAECDIYGSLVDLERATEGVCAAVEGSNELWMLGASCEVLYLLTFPTVPGCGASMPDNSFFFAGCPGPGLVVCAQSGEQVLLDGSYQGLADIALSGDYAVLASASDSVLFVLEK